MDTIAAGCQSECLAELEDVAELYAAHAARVRRLVTLSVQAPAPAIEDACQIAWTRLVRCRARVRRRTATAWLVQVAVNEAFKLVRRSGRDVSLEALAEHDGERRRSTPALLDELVAQRARLDAIRSLPERQQRLVWLQGLGFSYVEMAGETGATRRTVERQLLRARRSLEQAGA